MLRYHEETILAVGALVGEGGSSSNEQGSARRAASQFAAAPHFDFDGFELDDGFDDRMDEARKERRVILVDDDPNYGFIFQKVAEKSKLNVGLRRSSRDFIDQFQDDPAPVVLIDLDMTDLHGVAWKFAGVATVIEFRRRFGAAAQLWVVTGATDNPNLIAACLKAGADNFMWKDVEVAEICEQVSRLFD